MNRGTASDPNVPWDNVKVRRAVGLGIDRQAIIDQFFPEGSEVATHFAPCSMEFACEGDAWPEMDIEAAKTLLAEGLAESGFTQAEDGTWLNLDGVPWEIFVSYRVVDRGYLPLPDQVALAVVDQLQNNLGLRAKADEVESTTYIDIANFGLLKGIHLLGWTGDYPDPTNFLDYHFGQGATIQFGDIYTEVAEPLARAASTADSELRAEGYAEANNALIATVPMLPVSHAGSATAWQAGLEGAHSSPLGNEALFAVDGGEDGQIVFMQNGEPGGLYCADESDGESLRVCEQVMESLYGFKVGGNAYQPRLAEECVPNEDLSTWTCTLREGVTFHDGSTLDSGDVVLSYAVQWDRSHPLHLGRTSTFSYWGLWGGFLPAPAA
jgi:ABC-type transport system substrate-binding protein